MAAVIYAGSPVDAYLEDQGLGEMGCVVDEGEPLDGPASEPETAIDLPAKTSTTTDGEERHPAHDRLAALLVAHLNSPYAVAVASEHAHYADSPNVEAEAHGQTANSTTSTQVTLSRKGQLILVSLFGTVIAYPGLSASSTNANAATSTWATVWRMTPPLVILTGVVALWATSHHSTTTATSIPRQIKHRHDAGNAATRMDRALQDLTKHTIAFVQEWAEWETLAGRVVDVLDTLQGKRQRKQHKRHASSSRSSRRRSNSVDPAEGESEIYDLLCELSADIEEACSELFTEKYPTTSDGDQEARTSGIDMQELKLLLDMYVPHTMLTPAMAQEEMHSPSTRMTPEELIKARRRSWAAFPTSSTSNIQHIASSSPITRARSSEQHEINSLPGTPVRIRYPTSPNQAHTPRSSTSATPQAYLREQQVSEAGTNQGSASKVRGQRKRYSEQFVPGHSPSSTSFAAFESGNVGHSATVSSPLSLAAVSTSQAMQRAATTGSHPVLSDGGSRIEGARSSLDSPRGLLASGRLQINENRRIQAHHPSSPSLSISVSPSWAHSSPSVSRIKQRPLSTPNGLGLDWKSYQDQPALYSRYAESSPRAEHLSAHKRHSSSFSATKFSSYNNNNNEFSGKKARPTSLYLQASAKLLSPSARNGRFEVSYSGHEDEEDDLSEPYVGSRPIEVQEQLCRLDKKRKEILCVILALRAVPASSPPPTEKEEDQKEQQNTVVLIETCHSLGNSLSELSTILSESARSLREACTNHFGSSLSHILLPKPSKTTHGKELQEKSYFTRFPGQYPASPMIEVESASPSPTGSAHLYRSPSSRRNREARSHSRRHARSNRRTRSRSSSSSTSDDHEDNFAPKQAVPLHVREAVAEYKESSEKIEALLADLAMDVHVNKAGMEEWVDEYRGDRTDEDALGEVLERQEELRRNAQNLLSHVDHGRLALRRIRDTGRTSSSASKTAHISDARQGDEEDEEDISADITFSDDFLAKRGSLSSTLSSSANDELIATPPLKPSYGTNPEISLSSSISSSTGKHNVRNTISQLLLDPTNANVRNMPAFLNFQEKLYEADTMPAPAVDKQNVRSNNGKLSREERIALAKAKREAMHERDVRAEEEGVSQPTATLELVQELKDVVRILRDRRAPVMSPERAEDA